MSVVLMYHALYRGEDTSLIDDEDLPYAVSEADFIEQMDLLVARGVGIFDGSSNPEIVITFDDGHSSNLDIAVPVLLARQMPAYFFVTTGFIGKKAGFMNQNQLRTLGDTPRMQIGSHGVTHRFFDDLSSDESLLELVDSRSAIETITGRPCQSISFPGGRYNNQTLSQLIESGYVQWFDSTVATVPDTFFALPSTNGDLTEAGSLLPQKDQKAVGRIAVRRNMTMEEFKRIIGPDAAYFRQHRWRSQAKYLLRRIIGNRLYHGLYKSLSAR